MAMMTKSYTAMQQLSALRSMYDKSVTKYSIKPNGFIWYFDVSPTPLSDSYTIKLSYKADTSPKVFVMNPKPLKLAAGATKLPHVYSTSHQQICLYYPKSREWTDSMLIAKTIVHWAVEWLYYYEHWAYTGKWLGEGHGSYDAEFDKSIE